MPAEQMAGAGGTAPERRGGAPGGPHHDPQPERGAPGPPAAAGNGAAGAGGRGLDRIDRAILRLLQRDGRASIRSVAERVHVSRANAYARIARMVEDGVIRGFTARVDHERAGHGASAYVTLKIVQNSWRTVREQLLALPGVEHIALVSGEFDVLLLVHTVDNRALRELVLGRIQSLPAVLGTQTLLVFDETDQAPELPD
ncbi:Lrp/AsnC family transcriptional regulator [Streptacidiphilus sp. ASG 303]|uniref:Lrp/AsnC family transcriptional regulator n=1 Tax=Streptacidiphilus sp. ASG 303 TaxID=2896847 RepID=UPI001E4EA561|nr:Lrp/AsnC family transcriptional regulator [Streptacidiphilus sp. ASG 303]MCD0482258.1 Lrp/AsnC family transcriptional regulator [Streptacidiphilus sp. ASG 303]